tara:strand:+ start:1272 stop:3815 length:2544 start_codon:yes stop_codon:yes gene_type:complete
VPASDPVIDGDTQFLGVNMRLDPGQLKPGFVASAKNKRFVNGKASTRPGIKKMPWTNKAADAWEEKAYSAGDIVTYSGRASIIQGASSSVITGGTGTVSLFGTNASIANPNFVSNANWSTAVETNSAGVSIGGIGGSSGWAVDELDSNYAEHTAHSNGGDNLYQDIDSVLGCDYTITLTISNRTAGSVKVFLGTSITGASGALEDNITHTVTVTSGGDKPERLYIQATQDFNGRVDTISIAEGATPERVVLSPIRDISGGGGTLFNTGGPASNNSIPFGESSPAQIGPFFKRDESTDPGTAPPISDYDSSSNVSTPTVGWSDLGSRTYGYGTVYGSGIFRDPLGTEHILVVASDGVYATKEGNPSVKLLGQSSFSADVDLVQCFNVVVMFRGENLEPLVMERLDVGFVSIAKKVSDTDIDENDSDGTEPIPNASTGLFFGNRLLIPYNKDMVAASDFLNYTSYAPIMSNFRINQGSEDELVSLVRINNSTIACFKTNSIYIVSNIYGNLADITLDEVTREYGAVGRRSIVQVGNDVVFLSSKKGVTSLGVAANGKVSAVDVPLSEPIQPLIERINWNYAGEAVAAYHNNRLYMAVPLDKSTYNNAILVFDYLAGGWAGYDTGEAVKVKEFIETLHQGKRRLFFLDTDGFINLYDDDLTECGFVDEKPKSTVTSHDDFGLLEPVQISDEVVTRGYTAGDISSKRWKSAEVHLATNDPKFTVNALFDGPEEDGLELTPAGGQTFSRTSYDRPFDKADYVESMVNDDFMTKYRQDYSVNPDTEIDLPDGVGESDNIGFDPDLHQQSQNRYRYRGEGRYVQLKVANTNGRAELFAAKVGAVPGQNLTTKMI